jgi:alkaline phosphatase D
MMAGSNYFLMRMTAPARRCGWIFTATLTLTWPYRTISQPPPPPTKIAFGSCSRQDAPEQLWSEVVDQKPDLWIWLGDNIYGDSHDMAVLKKKYDQQKSHPGYQQLLKTCPVIGTWDDHDYGINDGGRHYAKKAESQQLLLDFLDVPAGSERRKRQGAYSSYTLGQGDHAIKIILLDTRYFRDTIYRAAPPERAYLPNPAGDILGEAQWNWLENELSASTAAFHIIGSSIQFISAEHAYEKWANFPAGQKRMENLLARLKPKNTLFISGDRHIGEVSKKNVEGLPYPLYDFTSSGLTHTWAAGRDEKNQYRVGQLIIEKNYGLLQFNRNANLPDVELMLIGKGNHVLQSIPVRLE